LRKETSNHPEGRWLKTVVLNVAGKGVTLIASGAGREDERWAQSPLPSEASKLVRWHQNQGARQVLG
jgi:hypothetical protein